MKRGVVICITCVVIISIVIAVLLAIFDAQQSDNSQYFACAIILVIIAIMCASHIYACISAERAQRQIRQNSSAGTGEMGKNTHNFLRKNVITTTLLIMSSLLSWIPLLVYFLINESVKERNVPLFIRYLTFCKSTLVQIRKKE